MEDGTCGRGRGHIWLIINDSMWTACHVLSLFPCSFGHISLRRGRGGSAREWQDKEKGAAAGVSAHFPFLALLLSCCCFGYNVMIMALAGRLTFLTKWVALRIIEATKSKARRHETKQRHRWSWSWSWSRSWTWTRRQLRLMMGSICASLSLQARHAVRVGVENTVGMAARPECPSREKDAATPNLLCLVPGALPCPSPVYSTHPAPDIFFVIVRRYEWFMANSSRVELKYRAQPPLPTPPAVRTRWQRENALQLTIVQGRDRSTC